MRLKSLAAFTCAALLALSLAACDKAPSPVSDAASTGTAADTSAATTPSTTADTTTEQTTTTTTESTKKPATKTTKKPITKKPTTKKPTTKKPTTAKPTTTVPKVTLPTGSNVPTGSPTPPPVTTTTQPPVSDQTVREALAKRQSAVDKYNENLDNYHVKMAYRQTISYGGEDIYQMDTTQEVFILSSNNQRTLLNLLDLHVNEETAAYSYTYMDGARTVTNDSVDGVQTAPYSEEEFQDMRVLDIFSNPTQEEIAAVTATADTLVFTLKTDSSEIDEVVDQLGAEVRNVIGKLTVRLDAAGNIRSETIDISMDCGITDPDSGQTEWFTAVVNISVAVDPRSESVVIAKPDWAAN